MLYFVKTGEEGVNFGVWINRMGEDAVEDVSLY